MSTQLTFTGASGCGEWSPNAFRKTTCGNCGKGFTEHRAEDVSETDIREYIAAVNSLAPCNVIIKPSEGVGGLLLGGVNGLLELGGGKHPYKAAVQTAKGIENFYPLVGKKVQEAEREKVITVLRMGWDDTSTQVLTDIDKAIAFIDAHRNNGDTVLVSCAQGKSRSSTLVIAYLLSIQHNGLTTVDAALSFVKSIRGIAEPNTGFMEQLHMMYTQK